MNSPESKFTSLQDITSVMKNDTEILTFKYKLSNLLSNGIIHPLYLMIFMTAKERYFY